MPDSEIGQILLEAARASIRYGLDHNRAQDVRLADYPQETHVLQACFVTLNIENRLRGCIGSLEARQPQIMDIIKNAHAAAFHDPRFPPLTEEEYDRLSIQLSLLGKPVEMETGSEEALLAALRPGIDGLILENGTMQRSTFLPVVWESLPEPRLFLSRLKQKAGLPGDYWSDTLRFKCYTVDCISE